MQLTAGICVCDCARACVRECACVSVYVCVSEYVSMCICVCVCMWPLHVRALETERKRDAERMDVPTLCVNPVRHV